MIESLDQRLRLPSGVFPKRHHVQLIFLIRARRGGNYHPFAVMRHLRAVPIFGLFGRCVNRFVFRLWGANFVKVNRLIVIQLLKRRAFLWFCETRIEKSFIPYPADIREFGPFDFVSQNFASRGIQHLDRAPVGTTVLNGISEQLAIFRGHPAIQRRRAILCPAIRVKQHAVSTLEAFTHI